MEPGNLVAGLMGSSLLTSFLTMACISAPFILIAFLLINSARRSKKQALASQNWPSVIGNIISSHVEVSSSTDAEGNSSTSYSPRVNYEYEVRGQRYQNGQISFGYHISFGDTNGAQAIIERYVPGNQVRVYYNTDNPAQAVLDRTVGNSSRVTLWIGVSIIAFVLLIMAIILASEFLHLVRINSL